MIGRTISHYKILEKLGEGGMGVVYKAKDTRLDRDVALKFLPHGLTITDDERQRFIHEAKSASALDHPSICTIYEVDETDDGRMFIAMGYYEGMSLSRRLEKGRLKVGEAISFATQIAEGLQAAHEKGIVHRDIKSSNIIITNGGQAKILDFGLAQKSGLTKLTRTGSTLGTASYMSPEQARGEKLDQRSDLWSFGVVLYEMVTGKLPFPGDHEPAILYSVVHEEPQPVEISLPEASVELVHIIRRALEKDPAERYRSAEDMLIDLRRLKKETTKTGFAPVRVSRKKNKVRHIPSAIVLVVIISAVGYLFIKPPPPVINPNWSQHRLNIPYTDISYPGISGDGNWIGFTAKARDGAIGLYVMNVNRGEPRSLLPLKMHGAVDVSNDGSLLLFNQFHGELSQWEGYTIYSNSGNPRKIIEGGCMAPRFSPDGERIGYFRGLHFGHPSPSGKLEFWSVGVERGDLRLEFIDSVSVQGSVSFSYSPEADKIAWLRTFHGGYQEIFIRDLDTGEEQQITYDEKYIDGLVWVRGGHILYSTKKGGARNLWAISAGGGAPVPITNVTDPVLAVKSSSDGKKILYLQQRTVADFWLVDVLHGRSKRITFTDENRYSPTLSPDGKMIAFILVDEGDVRGDNLKTSHLFVMDRDGNNRRQLSFGEESVARISWSPDSRWIAYGSREITEPDDSFRIYIIEPSMPKEPRYVAKGMPVHMVTWLDSSRIIGQIGITTYLFSVSQSPPERVYEDSTWALPTQGGRYLTYADYRAGKRRGIWITDGLKPRDEQERMARTIPNSDLGAKISYDGRYLFACQGPGKIMRMSIPDGNWEELDADFRNVSDYGDFSLGWDGSEIIVREGRKSSKYVMIEDLFK